MLDSKINAKAMPSFCTIFMQYIQPVKEAVAANLLLFGNNLTFLSELMRKSP
jgi:hypothetical protein